jgi:hypothetical protein
MVPGPPEAELGNAPLLPKASNVAEVLVLVRAMETKLTSKENVANTSAS